SSRKNRKSTSRRGTWGPEESVGARRAVPLHQTSVPPEPVLGLPGQRHTLEDPFVRYFPTKPDRIACLRRRSDLTESPSPWPSRGTRCSPECNGTWGEGNQG